MSKNFKSWRDISIKWNDKRESFVVNLRPLGLQPARKYAATKSEAIEEAQLAFERYSDPSFQPAVTKAVKGKAKRIVDITVAEALERWRVHEEARAENPDIDYGWGRYANTESFAKLLTNLELPDGRELGQLMLSDIDELELEGVWQALRNGVSFRTSDDKWQTLNNAFKHACKQSHMAYNPCPDIDRPRPKQRAAQIKRVIEGAAKVSMENLNKIVGAAEGRDRLMIMFACRTGLRQGETVALKIYRKTQAAEGGIDFANNRILVREAAKRGRKRSEKVIGNPKTVSGIRTIPIDPDFAADLKAYWDALPKRMRGERYLFPSQDGTMQDGCNVRKRCLYKACKAAGLPRELWPTWHELRHAFATHYLNNHKDWRRGMELMGHSSISTTMIYDHVVEDPDRDIREAKSIAASMRFDLDDQNAADGNVVKFKKAI